MKHDVETNEASSRRGRGLRVQTGIKAGPTATLGGKEPEPDEDGFIQDPDLWIRGVA
jgi:hypothetical protein